MSFAQTIALGALAGFTIYFGLPAGRLKLLGTRLRVAMAMFSVGVLAFIFVDVLSNGWAIVEDGVMAVRAGHGSLGHVAWLVFLLGAGFVSGCAGLAMLERSFRPWGARRPPIAGGAQGAVLTLSDAERLAADADASRRRAL